MFKCCNQDMILKINKFKYYKCEICGKTIDAGGTLQHDLGITHIEASLKLSPASFIKDIK